MIKKILWSIATIVVTVLLTLVPFKDNYNIISENDRTGMMHVKYTSLIPFVKRDTIVPMPKPYYGKVLVHKKLKSKNGRIKYVVVTEVGNRMYEFDTQQAYDYVNVMRIENTDSFRLQEIFWPFHCVKSLQLFLYKDIN